jgi:uncharacterized protein (TIGR02001 family)
MFAAIPASKRFFHNPDKDTNMQKLPKALLLAGFMGLSSGLALAQTAPAPAPAEPPPSDHTFTGKVALYSEYEYRGISQTSEKPALQLNLDYAHSSGFYLGTFLTNIKWLKDTAEAGNFSSSAKLEWDIYGGWRKEIVKDVTLDVGYLRYEYPSSGAFATSPNTDEIYAGLTWQQFNVKYSYSLNNTFGFANSEGSDFIEGNVAWPLLDNKLTITGHIGHQRYKNNEDFSYTVWKLGAVYDFGGGFTAGGYVKGTDAEPSLYTVKGKDWSKDRLVAFVAYSF